MKTLYIVVPCYNEEQCLPLTHPVFLKKLEQLIGDGLVRPDSRVLYVDDGSGDGTWGLIDSYCTQSPLVCGLRLSPNRGHQNAVTAGLMEAKDRADFSISIDADLQDDINAMDAMIRKAEAGYDLVCGVRDSRATDTFLKRFTARAYYGLMNLLGAKLVFDHADYRLMDRAALEALSLYHGEDLFLRGLVTRLHLPLTTVTYDRAARAAGSSKYTLKKMLKLAMKGLGCRRMKPADTPRPRDPHIAEERFR